MDVTGKIAVVFGLAGSGRAAARLLVERGAVVIGVDAKLDVEPIPGVRLELGPASNETFTSADLVVVSPGVPAKAAPIVAARAAGVPVMGEVHLAASFLDWPVAAITGTNGKSTVTHFVGQLLEACGKKPFVGGNLGRAYSEAALAVNAGRYQCAVVEISSYQMELPNGELQPKIAAIINLTPDHLARHGTMENYGAHKARLFDTMTQLEVAVLPAGDEFLAKLADGHGNPTRAYIGALPGVVRDGNLVGVQLPGLDATFDLSAFTVPGDHNRDNAALAALVALVMGAPAEAVQAALPKLQALPHRMEVIAEAAGITWINDSKATNVAAALVGVTGLGRGGVLLLGGEAKGDSFAELAPHLGEWKVVCFGGSGPAIAQELSDQGVATTTVPWLRDAVLAAARLARAGDAVLLSPGCASFDEFKNFEQRGTTFRELVGALP